MINKKVHCEACGRLVRVRSDGRLFKHLARIATPTSGGRECTNRHRALPEGKYDENGVRRG